MTMFEQPVLPDETAKTPPAAPIKRPSRWSLSSWSVRKKVLLIAIIPIALAMAFAGMRVYANVTDARTLRLGADRGELVRPIENYTAALENALLASSTGADVAAARKEFDDSRAQLQRQLDSIDVDVDVRSGIATLLSSGPALLDAAASNGIGLRDTVTSYAPILLTAEDAIVGSVRIDDEQIRSQAQGLSRAVGARGQMFMQKLLVNRGGELLEPELRTSMSTLAGTEPSTLFGMNQVLGVGSSDAKTLQQQLITRLRIISDPATVLAGNPELLASLQTTDDVATKVIDSTTSAVTTAVSDRASAARTTAIRDSAVVLGAILVAVLLVLLVARSLVRPLRRLRAGALRVAHEDLPTALDRLRAGILPGPIQPIPVHTTEEIGQVAHAVDDLHEQALLLAADQARLQLHVSDMFETLSRRSRTLVDAQVSVIDTLERDEDDPARLDSLFKLDHLAARMRRNGTNLLVLSGVKVPREHAESLPVGFVVNAAASQVEDYPRVVVDTVPDSAVVGSAAGDIVHLLAELIDNALRYSPPTEPVRVSAVHSGQRGLVIEVSDTGLGMTEADLRMANTRLGSGGEVTPHTARHMGLFVAGRLAVQHGLVVRLRSAVAGDPRSGTTAGVVVPAELTDRVTEAPSSPDREVPHLASDEPSDEASDNVQAVPRHRDAELIGQPYRNGSTGHDGSALPRRDPGTSGIVGTGGEVPESVPEPPGAEPPAGSPGAEPPAGSPGAEPAPVQPTAPPSPGDTEDVIFQRMLSEWLVDPTELMPPLQSWESVWDSGWAAASDAEVAPVDRRTEQGLPVRDPGARLVPGSPGVGDRPNGAAHRRPDDSATPHDAPRDPDAVRASLSNHWGGVRAGRSHARHEDRDEDRDNG